MNRICCSKLPPKADPKKDDSKPPWPRAPLKNPGRRFETSTGASKPGDQGGSPGTPGCHLLKLCPWVRFPALICRVSEGSMQKMMELLNRYPDTRLRTDQGGGK